MNIISAILFSGFLFQINLMSFSLQTMPFPRSCTKITLLLSPLTSKIPLISFQARLYFRCISSGSAPFPFEFFHIFPLYLYLFHLSGSLSCPLSLRSMFRCFLSRRSASSLATRIVRPAASSVFRCSLGLNFLSSPRISRNCS